MRSKKNWLSSLAVCALLLTGCASTVTPKQVQSSVASWDGNAQNSGFIGWTTNNGGIITWRAHSRYIALIADYGYKFKPPLQSDEGATLTATNTWVIDAQHLSYFATMSRWKKQGVK